MCRLTFWTCTASLGCTLLPLKQMAKLQLRKWKTLFVEESTETLLKKNKLSVLIKYLQETEVNSVKAAGEQQLMTLGQVP